MSRREQVVTRLNAIADPCSCATGEPIGIVDMGIVRDIRVTGDRVEIDILPTFPGCLYVGMFEHEAEQRLLALPWCAGVTVRQVSSGDDVWSEARMAPAARERLAQRRAERRLALDAGRAAA